MAGTDTMSQSEVREALRRERQGLVESLDGLRVELGRTAGMRGKVRRALPLAALGAGFVASGGIGAAARYAFRRSREGEVKAKAGRFALIRRRRS